MQRQDDYQITRDDMLLFIARLASVADLIFAIAACGRSVDDRFLASLRRTEYAMLILLGGILRNVDTRRDITGLDPFRAVGVSVDRAAELRRLAVSIRQIATALAMILSMSARAFRDRAREDVLQSAFSLSMARAGGTMPAAPAQHQAVAIRSQIPP